MGKIALCIPAFNAAWCLPRLLQSANAQLIPFDEILVYNDCSTDNTSEVAKSYGAKVIEGDINRGCSFGKNKLAEITNCEWIHFHDADDDLLPNFTTIAHQWIDKETCPDIILLNFEYRDFENFTLLGSPDYNILGLKNDTVKFVLENKIVNFAICNKERFIKIGGFDLAPEVLYNEDRAFYTRAAICRLTFDFEPDITCLNYRYNSSMSVSNSLKCVWAYFNVSKKAAKALGKKYSVELAKGLWHNATIAASYQDWTLVKKNINLAISLNGRIPLGQPSLIRALAIINPVFSYWFREKLIRLLKPSLRKIQ